MKRIVRICAVISLTGILLAVGYCILTARTEHIILGKLAGCEPAYTEVLGPIRTLELTGRVADQDLTLLRGFKWLRTLDLAASRFRGGFERVFNPENNITDGGLAHLSELSRLDWLSLQDTKVTDEGLRHLAALRNLRVLILSGTSVSGSGLVHLAELSKLDHLQLDSTALRDDGLAGLSQLDQVAWLELRNTQVSDQGMVHLRGMVNLKYLALDGTNVTDAGIRKLKEYLPNCTIWN